MSSDKDILGVSTSLLTVLALAATSKIWVLGLPILLVVDAVEELRSQGEFSLFGRVQGAAVLVKKSPMTLSTAF